MSRKLPQIPIRKFYEILDDAESLVDSDLETIEWIRDQLKKLENERG